MVAIIKLMFAVFWAASAGLIGLLAYSVLTTEHSPQIIWAWLLMCGFTLLSATWLTYNIIFGYRHRPEPKHHDLHLK